MEQFENTSMLFLGILIIAETIIRFRNGFCAAEAKDSIACLFIGISSLGISFLMKGYFLNIFHSATTQLTLSSFPVSLILILFILNDFGTYWYHRLAHSSRFFWATHIVHHSSTKFNLTVSLRESIIEGVYRFMYWSVYCLIGFPAIVVFFVDGVSLIYQGIIHTKYIRKLGWLDKILNTPANHRVHHSSNPEYIDKNFGGVFIIWDRLFGTYCEETITPVYGATGEPDSLNPIQINIAEWKRIFTLLSKSRNVKQILKSLFGSPDGKIKNQ